MVLCLCLTDALKLKKRILTILKIFKPEEIKPRANDVKFSLKITPFAQKNFLVGVEYMHKIDMIRVVVSIGIGTKLMDHYKQKKEAEKNEIWSIFSKSMRARNFNVMITKDFSALEGFKLLIQQNMSAQGLFDTVSEGMLLLQDLGELLYQADQSLKVPKASQSGQNMFQ